jgi:hypothetical protein
MEFKYLVVDDEGEPLRKFYSLSQAEWFSRLKYDCKIIRLNFKTDEQIREELFKQVGEALF